MDKPLSFDAPVRLHLDAVPPATPTSIAAPHGGRPARNLAPTQKMGARKVGETFNSTNLAPSASVRRRREKDAIKEGERRGTHVFAALMTPAAPATPSAR